MIQLKDSGVGGILHFLLLELYYYIGQRTENCVALKTFSLYSTSYTLLLYLNNNHWWIMVGRNRSVIDRDNKAQMVGYRNKIAGETV